MKLVPSLPRAGGSKLCILMLFSFLSQIGTKVKPKIMPRVGPLKSTLTHCTKIVGVEILAALRRQATCQNYVAHAMEQTNQAITAW